MTDHDRPTADDERSALVQDLRATGDALSHDLNRLTEIEVEKDQLAPGDARLDRLSEEAVRLAQRVEHEARAERDLGREIR